MSINFSRIDTDEIEFTMTGKPDIDMEVAFKLPDPRIILGSPEDKDVFDTLNIVKENTITEKDLMSIHKRLVSIINDCSTEECVTSSTIKESKKILGSISKVDENIFMNILIFIKEYIEILIDTVNKDSFNNIKAMAHINDPEPEFTGEEEAVSSWEDGLIAPGSFVLRDPATNDENNDEDDWDLIEVNWDKLINDALKDLGYNEDIPIRPFIRFPNEPVEFTADEVTVAKCRLMDLCRYIISNIKYGVYDRKLVFHIEPTFHAVDGENGKTLDINLSMMDDDDFYKAASNMLVYLLRVMYDTKNDTIFSAKAIEAFYSESFTIPPRFLHMYQNIMDDINDDNDREVVCDSFLDAIKNYIVDIYDGLDEDEFTIIYRDGKFIFIGVVHEERVNKEEQVLSIQEENDIKSKIDEQISEKYHHVCQSSEECCESQESETTN